jgi:hypothetical protein
MRIDAGYSIARILFAGELVAGPIAAFPGKSRPNVHGGDLEGIRGRCRWLAMVLSGLRVNGYGADPGRRHRLRHRGGRQCNRLEQDEDKEAVPL